ncbi:hypothetical protein CF319_g1352 [Tilletia indica]|nr:hypothetical protein CF319_g1352 [Tilletia indica]
MTGGPVHILAPISPPSSPYPSPPSSPSPTKQVFAPPSAPSQSQARSLSTGGEGASVYGTGGSNLRASPAADSAAAAAKDVEVPESICCFDDADRDTQPRQERPILIIPLLRSPRTAGGSGFSRELPTSQSAVVVETYVPALMQTAIRSGWKPLRKKITSMGTTSVFEPTANPAFIIYFHSSTSSCFTPLPLLSSPVLSSQLSFFHSPQISRSDKSPVSTTRPRLPENHHNLQSFTLSAEEEVATQPSVLLLCSPFNHLVTVSSSRIHNQAISFIDQSDYHHTLTHQWAAISQLKQYIVSFVVCGLVLERCMGSSGRTSNENDRLFAFVHLSSCPGSCPRLGSPCVVTFIKNCAFTDVLRP